MHTLLCVLLFVACFFSLSLGDSKHKSRDNQQSHEDILAYWTEARMNEAASLDVIEREGEPVPVDLNANVDSDFSRVSPPQYGDGKESIFFSSTSEENNTTPEFASTHGKRYPFPYTSGYAPSYTSHPWRAVGKVFFTQGGSNYVCSAASLRPYIISTAGHCVWDAIGGKGWSYNFIFVPGYNNGNRPYGSWSSYQLWTSNDWYRSASFCKDYAIAVLNKNNGQGIGDVVGYFGYLFNGNQQLSWRALGYPAAAPFNGQLNYYADSALGVVDSGCGGRCGSSGCTPAALGIGSDATGGTSGGPWIYEWGSGYYLNSVNSYKYTQSQPGAIYGPYFDSEWANLLTTTVAITPP